MGVVKICFVLAFNLPGAELPEHIEELYQTRYKKILSFLYTHPEMRLSFFVSGRILEWIEKKHDEIISICSEMVDRRQIEVLGGGYYEPLFPLLLPADRSAQIEALTTAIRKAAGKRPRGAYLTESVWDPSLISSFNTCGIEYTLLDSRFIPQSGFRPVSIFSPLVVEEMGKTTTVIPLHQSSLPRSGQNPADYLEFTHTIASSGDSSILACVFTPQQFYTLLEEKWFERFSQLLEEDTVTSLSLPQRYLKQYRTRFPAYIPAGCMSEAAMWTLEPFIPHTRVFSESMRPTVKDFLTVYPEARALYSRMMYVSMLISQCRGDKARKKAAREELHAAQHFAPYIYKGRGGISDRTLRCRTYKRLLNAEKILREASGFKDNASAFDFTMSGRRDFLCCFESFNAFVCLQGGLLFEFDIMHNAVNYCTAARHCAKDGSTYALYEKKMFVDHLWDTDDFQSFTSDSYTGSPVFAACEYRELGFDRMKKEIRLAVSGVWGKDRLPVTLKKNYSLSENGVICQYILKNEGQQPLKAKFGVEHNISIPSNAANVLNAEAVVCDARETPCSDTAYIRQSGISFVQLGDTDSEINFIFEPNESCGFYLAPFYTSLQNEDGSFVKQYEAHTCAFYWDVNLLPGMETEKILNMTVKAPKKNTVAKKPKKR
ncbi:alpha-amylase/4-alpha-glucanotransferase domain-containing protein [Treponema sp. HNW]|uniref:alpha-amylase/4-alpha-glucanotransferase domain-containing protein n=1 Tax=Treponema sp. HNW TaxID=3116654 RepID=UPI003D10DC10